MAERAMRNSPLAIVNQRLVCHTSTKKAGRLRKAARRSFKVKGSGRIFFSGRLFKVACYFNCKTKEFKYA